MDESEISRPSPFEVDDDKRNGGPGTDSAVVVFTSKKLQWTAFALILFARFTMLLVEEVVLNLTPHVMSNFSQSAHSVLSVLPMVLGILSGVLRLPMAKIIDRHGRKNGFHLAWLIWNLGLLFLTGAQSLAATVAGQIFYGIGSSLLDFVFTVILADMTSLKNRALIYGIYVTPVILTTFAAPYLAQLLDWRSTFGVCDIIIILPLGLLSPVLSISRAKLLEKDEESGATTTKQKPTLHSRLGRFLVELDVPGVCLAIAGISLMLLAPRYFPWTQEGWPERSFWFMPILGAKSLAFLFIWENGLAPATTCFPWHLMMSDKSLFNGCLVVLFSAASTACWGSYYSSYLQVVHDETNITASRIISTRILASAISAPVLGLLLRQTGDHKLPALFGGGLLGTLTGFLLVFREPEVPGSILLMFQAGLGVGERVLIACSQMAVVANVEHKHVAMALGTWGTFLSIGVAIGYTTATAIWTNALPRILNDNLPLPAGAARNNLTSELLGSLEKQKEYPVGSPIRDAVVAAYWAAQDYVVFPAACIVAVAFSCIFMWKNIDLRKRNDVQGARAKGVLW